MNAAVATIDADAIGRQLDETPCPEHGADRLVKQIADKQSGPVDVLAAMVSLASFGGTISPRQVRTEWNVPRGTGLIASRARWLNDLHTKLPTTAAVGRALRLAEREGLVIRSGTGATHCKAWNKNAAETREIYWQLTDAAIARIGGAA